MDFVSRIILFLEVVECGSFARASELRNLDRSVVSKQIRKLEEELGVRLLNRTTRSLSITSAGAEMVKQAIIHREQVAQTKHLAETFLSKPQGLLKITTTTLFGRIYVQEAIIEFQKQYPEVEVELRLDDRLVDIVGEGFDLAFRVGDPKDSSLIARYMARNRLIMLASPEFVERYGQPDNIDYLSTLPAAIYAGEGQVVNTINYIDQAGEPQVLTLNPVYRTNEGELLMDAVSRGCMYCVAAAFMVRDEIIAKRLVPIMTDLRLPDFAAIYALYPHRNLPIRTRLFLDTVRRIVGEDVPAWEKNIPGYDLMYGYADRKQWRSNVDAINKRKGK